MMDLIKLGTRREVCWDEYLMDQVDGVCVRMHKPEYRGIAFTCDAPWEGAECGYFIVHQDINRIRLYYKSAHEVSESDHKARYMGGLCYAESRDGKVFHRVNVGQVNFDGRTENNILDVPEKDNFAVCYDANPDCKAGSRFKGLTGNSEQQLELFVSSDGVNFEKKGVVTEDGAYDSMNIVFWERHSEQYFLYYRGLHGPDSVNGQWPTDQKFDNRHQPGIFRDVRVRTSKDLHHWSEPRLLDFGPDEDDYQLYTNQTKPYYRADHMFLGMPTRYVDRVHDTKNFKHLPDWRHRMNIIKQWGRGGTAMNDCVLMTSRDGFHFRRTNEAFFTPGIERDHNWYYGDCYFALGMVETTSDMPGAPNEISLYTGLNYKVGPIELARYAIRLDGFFSWHCDYKPGSVLTKPFTHDGNALTVNFATSALGYVRICLCDANGTPLEGYDSGRMFGDSADRFVDFDADLENLAGKTIRMKIEMSDAELYSFKFERMSHIWPDD